MRAFKPSRVVCVLGVSLSGQFPRIFRRDGVFYVATRATRTCIVGNLALEILG